MSIATTQKSNQFSRDKILGRLDGHAIIEKTTKKIKQDLFGVLTFFAVVITGLGFLFGREFNFYWYFLTALLVGLSIFERSRERIEYNHAQDIPIQFDKNKEKDVRNH